MIFSFLFFCFSFLVSKVYNTAESVKQDKYVKQTVILSSNMDSLLAEMTRLFGPYESRLLESTIKDYLPQNWHDPQAKVEIYYIKTQKSKIIQYLLFLGSGKKIEILFKDFEKCIVVEEAPDLIKLELDPNYNFNAYKLPKVLLSNIQNFLKKIPKNYKQYRRLIVYYQANFSICAILFVNQKNQKEYCIFFDNMIVNRNGYSLEKTVWPVYYGLNIKTQITSGFGMRYHPVLKMKKFHAGIDLRASIGTEVFAVSDGKVIFRGWLGGYGYCIKISHPNNVISLYAHLSKFSSHLSLGSYVKRGSLIAYSGSTGLSTAPHLHFEIRVHNRPVNPVGFRFSFYRTIQESLRKDFENFIKQIESMVEE